MAASQRTACPAAPPLQVDLTFTAEGTDADPNPISFRGLDNAMYYRRGSSGVRRRNAGCAPASRGGSWLPSFEHEGLRGCCSCSGGLLP